MVAQSYAPAPGQLGSTAISKDSNVIIAWATGVEIARGPLDIADPSLGTASHGMDQDALGPAEGDGVLVVSLGDGGSATLTFSTPIMNGSGPDFAVFENGFADNYMEFAFVEVSSDGQNFARFPAFSETPTDLQIDNFMFGDCRYVHNLAGKYRQGFGTPFDLDELNSGIPINLNAITHLRLVDVVGSIDPMYGSEDSQGNLINDPYPTAFASGGFDLDAVGVIHQAPLSQNELTEVVSVYPNPTRENIFISLPETCLIELYSMEGKLLRSIPSFVTGALDLEEYRGSFVLLKITGNNFYMTERILVQE
jgi:hypothetical protein